MQPSGLQGLKIFKMPITLRNAKVKLAKKRKIFASTDSSQHGSLFLGVENHVDEFEVMNIDDSIEYHH